MLLHTKTTATANQPTPCSTVESSILNTPSTEPLYRFRLNHPKNYLGVPIAIAATDPAETLIADHLVSMLKEVTAGAEDLDLITRHKKLTARGTWFLTAIDEQFKTPQAALREFDAESNTRFCEAFPELTPIAQAVFASQPHITALLESLSSHSEFTLPEITAELATASPEAAENIFIGNSDAIDLSPSEQPNSNSSHLGATDSIEYRTGTTLQLKSLLYHLGILTDSGVKSTNHVPKDDIWALSPHLSEAVTAHIQTNQPEVSN